MALKSSVKSYANGSPKKKMMGGLQPSKNDETDDGYHMTSSTYLYIKNYTQFLYSYITLCTSQKHVELELRHHASPPSHQKMVDGDDDHSHCTHMHMYTSINDVLAHLTPPLQYRCY